MLAIVRPPGTTFANALSHHPGRDSIDVDRARAQHSAYVATLQALGVNVLDLPADERYPDACFTQDVAIVVRGHVLLTRPGVDLRRGEPGLVAQHLAPLVRSLQSTGAPATLEGGDVVQLERRLIVGRSARTNSEGVIALRRFAEPLGVQVTEAGVPVGILHLLTVLTVLPDGLAMGTAEALSQPAFRHMRTLEVPDEERGGCNALCIRNHVVLGGSYPWLRRSLQREGFTVHEIDLSEFEKADGGPTCLSLLLPDVDRDDGARAPSCPPPSMV
ncbi:MAG: dimethylarginine dimethylaminohydrolase [Chloroflexota bacterium]